MYMRAVPPGAISCGCGTFNVEGAANSTVAKIAATFPTAQSNERVNAVVVGRLSNDPALVAALSLKGQQQCGYTLDEGEPIETAPGSWQVGFTAYLFDVARN